MAKETKDLSKLSYTEASARLEAIVRHIEHDSPSVDQLTDLVSEAVALAKFCRERLTKADKQLQELMAQLDEDPKGDEA